MPAVANLLKQHFCYGNKLHCARYQVAMAGMKVPPDLLPNDTARAGEILQHS